MSVFDINEFKRHGSSANHRIFDTTGRAKTTVTAKRNDFQLATMGATIHGTAKGWVAAFNHFVNILHPGFSGIKRVFNYFIIVCKNFLQYIHKTIMMQN